LKLSLRPAIIVAVPAVLLAAQMEALFGSKPLAAGDEALVTLQLKTEESPIHAELIATPAFRIESPAVRIPEMRQVYWRIRAIENADGVLRLKVDGEDVERPLRAGPGYGYVSPTCSSTSAASIWYACRIRSRTVESIHVDYPARSLSLAGLEAHWLTWFTLAWLLAMIMLKSRLKVTF
jgi:hypothetical protein